MKNGMLFRDSPLENYVSGCILFSTVSLSKYMKGGLPPTFYNLMMLSCAKNYASTGSSFFLFVGDVYERNN